LLDNEPVAAPGYTYSNSYTAGVVTSESWSVTGGNLLKNLAYTYTNGLCTQEVRTIYAADGVTVTCKLTIVYTYTQGAVSSATYTRNV